MTGRCTVRAAMHEFAADHSREDCHLAIVALLALGFPNTAELLAQADAVIRAAEDAAAGGTDSPEVTP